MTIKEVTENKENSYIVNMTYSSILNQKPKSASYVTLYNSFV